MFQWNSYLSYGPTTAHPDSPSNLVCLFLVISVVQHQAPSCHCANSCKTEKMWGKVAKLDTKHTVVAGAIEKPKRGDVKLQ